MKAIALLIVAVSLVAGVVGALTAYLPRLSLAARSPESFTYIDAEGMRVPIELNAAVLADPGPSPIAAAGDPLTPERIEQIRRASLRARPIERVRVRQFSLQRWDMWWLFAAGCAGLVVGAVLMRAGRGRVAMPAAGAPATAEMTPEEALDELVEGVANLRDEVNRLGVERARLDAITTRVGAMQSGPVASFIAARPGLISRLGVGGYAQLMDRFAGAERKLNRAWSAAADAHDEEARLSLEEAEELMRVARDWLKGRPGK